MIEFEKARRASAAEASQLRSRRDNRTADVLRLERVLANRLLVLRRLADSLIFTMIGLNPWIAKRFVAQKHMREG